MELPRGMSLEISKPAQRRSAVLHGLLALLLIGITTFWIGAALLELLEISEWVNGLFWVLIWSIIVFILNWCLITAVIILGVRRRREKHEELSGNVELTETHLDVGRRSIAWKSVRAVEVTPFDIIIRYTDSGRNLQLYIPRSWLPSHAAEQISGHSARQA